jgi:alpha-galactosidase
MKRESEMLRIQSYLSGLISWATRISTVYFFDNIPVDDCWQMEERTSEGNLIADPVKFPNGILAVSRYVHSIGLKLGLYSDAGVYTCAGYPGSYGYETQDAALFASWEIDFLKFDNCFAAGEIGSDNASYKRFKRMSDAILETGRPILFSLCNWGDDRSWYWAHLISNSYRISGDIYGCSYL